MWVVRFNRRMVREVSSQFYNRISRLVAPIVAIVWCMPTSSLDLILLSWSIFLNSILHLNHQPLAPLSPSPAAEEGSYQPPDNCIGPLPNTDIYWQALVAPISPTINMEIWKLSCNPILSYNMKGVTGLAAAIK